MNIERRHVLRAMPVLPMVAITRPANAATTDLVLNCDTALGPVMTAAAARFRERAGVRVVVFPTPPGLVLPQLSRQIQNDLICVRRPVGEAAVQAGLVAQDGLRGGWRNRLVIAARQEATHQGAAHQGEAGAALKGRIAVSDATPGSDMDGPAIVHALGLGQAGIAGVIDTDEVAFLLLRGEVEAGLLHMTDIRAHSGLAVLRAVPDEVAPPIDYAIAVTKLAARPNPGAFIDFILSAEGQTVMRARGLEVTS